MIKIENLEDGSFMAIRQKAKISLTQMICMGHHVSVNSKKPKTETTEQYQNSNHPKHKNK